MSSIVGSAVITPADYEFYTKPWSWQGDAFLKSAEQDDYALLAEPRCGKSKPMIDRLAFRWRLPKDHPGHVNMALIVSMPAAVPLNWEERELPTHLPPDIPRLVITWVTGVKHRKAFHELCRQAETFDGLVIVLTNGETILSEPFLQFLRGMFPRRRVATYWDETSLICKDPKTKRFKKAYAISHQPQVVMSGIADGTPIGNGPLDLWSQFALLDKKYLGFDEFATFQAHHSTPQRQYDGDNWAAYNEALEEAIARGLRGQSANDYAERRARGKGASWPGLKRGPDGFPLYKNLDELWTKIEPVSTRIRRKDVFDAPDQIHQIHPYEMSAEQRRVFDQLKEQYEVELQNMERVEARHVLDRMTKLQMVTSNFWPSQRSMLACSRCDGETDDCPVCDGAGFVEGAKEPPRIVDPMLNPRMDELRHIMRSGQQAIVWCRFHPSLDMVQESLRAMGFNPRELSGRATAAEKQQLKVDFQKGLFNPVVGTTRAGGRGVWLPADLMVFYEPTYSLLDTLQAQDRTEGGEDKRHSHQKGTDVVWLQAERSRDPLVIGALRSKRRVSDVILKERSGRWL